MMYVIHLLYFLFLFVLFWKSMDFR